MTIEDLRGYLRVACQLQGHLLPVGDDAAMLFAAESIQRRHGVQS